MPQISIIKKSDVEKARRFDAENRNLDIEKVENLADKMLKLNKDLQKLDSMLDEKEYKEIKEEIEKIDKEIDERVFKLYNLTEEEISIIKK